MVIRSPCGAPRAPQGAGVSPSGSRAGMPATETQYKEVLWLGEGLNAAERKGRLRHPGTG